VSGYDYERAREEEWEREEWEFERGVAARDRRDDFTPAAVLRGERETASGLEMARGVMVGMLLGLAVWVVVILVCFAVAATAQPARWQAGVASVYDGVALGGRVACLGYWPGGMVVAHRSLRCGTRVRLWYRGRAVTARVWDRGPFVRGRDFDLDVRVQRALRFPFGVAPVLWRVVP
jgi:rare lipoprotein A (peptidoglycan hydrolase)